MKSTLQENYLISKPQRIIKKPEMILEPNELTQTKKTSQALIKRNFAIPSNTNPDIYTCSQMGLRKQTKQHVLNSNNYVLNNNNYQESCSNGKLHLHS